MSDVFMWTQSVKNFVPHTNCLTHTLTGNRRRACTPPPTDYSGACQYRGAQWAMVLSHPLARNRRPLSTEESDITTHPPRHDREHVQVDTVLVRQFNQNDEQRPWVDGGHRRSGWPHCTRVQIWHPLWTTHLKLVSGRRQFPFQRLTLGKPGALVWVGARQSGQGGGKRAHPQGTRSTASNQVGLNEDPCAP